MVECESILTAQQLSEILVLIDTWWNVNKVKAKVFEEGKPVLIDTWWNVNKQYEHDYGYYSSFNRYMVECE